jgi:hypothetical protein
VFYPFIIVDGKAASSDNNMNMRIPFEVCPNVAATNQSGTKPLCHHNPEVYL